MATIWKKKRANKKLLDYGTAGVKLETSAPLKVYRTYSNEKTGTFGEMKLQLTFLGHRFMLV